MAELLREGKGPLSSEIEKCTEDQPPGYREGQLLHWSNPLLLLYKLSANLPLEPPHDLPYAFPMAVVCFLQLPPC